MKLICLYFYLNYCCIEYHFDTFRSISTFIFVSNPKASLRIYKSLLLVIKIRSVQMQSPVIKEGDTNAER